jgi:RNA polymerase subunit RPABC4/transcription elongation factor Spt4
MKETKHTCPLCKEAISENAEICYHCGERITGKICEDCLTMCPENAKLCRWCGFKFRQTTKRIGIEEFEIRAKHLPTFLFRLRLLCKSIRFNEEKVIVSTPGLFRLWVNEAEVPWNKVAGFDYRSGIFWDSVEIETRGQKPQPSHRKC